MLTSIELIIPEILLILAVCSCLMTSAFAGKNFKMIFPSLFVTPLLIALLVYVFLGSEGSGNVFSREFLQIDGISQYSKFLLFFITFGSIITATHHLKSADFTTQEHRVDYFPVLILSAIGICIMVSAADLITLYMGLELQSLALYIMIAFRRDSSISSEAALKYLILGAVGSGLFLFGTSLIYGMTGSVHYEDIYHFEVFIGSTLFFTIGTVLVLISLLFKLSVVPFHMWTPDVYQGTPPFITAFIATAPKIAAAVSIIRLTEYAFDPSAEQLTDVLILASILSLAIGAIMAVRQNSIYRMMAYSAITHMGYNLLAISTSQDTAYKLVLEYLTIYSITSFGLFTIFSIITKKDKPISHIDDLAGLGSYKPTYAFLITVFMLSLAGIPPLAGFFVKFNILYNVVQSDYILLSVMAVMASAVSAYYYLRIIKTIYFDTSDTPFDTVSPRSLFVLSAICAFVLMFYVFYPSFVSDLIYHFDAVFYSVS